MARSLLSLCIRGGACREPCILDFRLANPDNREARLLGGQINGKIKN